MGGQDPAGGWRHPRMRPAWLGQGPGRPTCQEALRLAWDEPLPGLSSEEAVAAVRAVLGAAGGSGPKTMTRAAFDALSPLERAAKMKDEAREQKARCQTNAALRL
jgi:hypothetical protein